MISIKQINEKDIDLCYELDSNTISLWSKKQWTKEFKKEGIKVFGILLSNNVIGICVFHVVLDEAQINFFAVSHKYRKKGFGTYLMSYLINECKKLNVNNIANGLTKTRSGYLNSFFKKMFFKKLNYIENGYIEIDIDNKVQSFGDKKSNDKVRLKILSQDFFTLLGSGGLNGAAEAYSLGLWELSLIHI